MRRDVFQAIADPVRREIIVLLAQRSLKLNAIAEQFPISRPAISRHIRILNECGLIVIHQQGRERHCEIKAEKLDEVTEWLQQFKARWEERLDNFEDYLETLKAERAQEEGQDPAP